MPEEKRYLTDVRLAKIETSLDNITPKIEVIFKLLNEDVMPKVHTIPFLTKGFWLLASTILGITAWLVKGVIEK